MNTENKMHFDPAPLARPSYEQASWSERLRHSKALIPTMAVLGVTTLALAATLVGQRSEALSGGQQAAEAVVQSPQALAQQATGKEASTNPASNATTNPATNAAVKSNAAQTPEAPATVATAKKGVLCSTCGTVESVTTVHRQGSVNGIGNSGVGVGAIGGAVVGGLLGHQVGGGTGKKVATVLGAVGGGYAGHAIEKNANSYTAYQMHVRMNDGTVRVIEQRSAIAAGSQVTVKGNTLRVLPPASEQSLIFSESSGVRG